MLIPLTDMQVKVDITAGLVVMDISMEYQNNRDSPLEVSFQMEL